MNLLIFGASGKTGHELVRQALELGHHVTAFVRTPSKLKLSHTRLKVDQGDVGNYPAVAEAVKGHDAVLSALGASSPFRYDRAVVDGMKNIVRAMEQEGVRRLIYLSAINVRGSRKHAGLILRVVATTLLRTETKGHEAREHIIAASRLDWTMVRSATFAKRAPTGAYRSGEGLKAKGVAVSMTRADAAHFMLRQLTDNAFVRKAPTIMY